MAATENLIKALAVACELTGTELSKAALTVMANDLSAYPERQTLAALERCRRELRGRLTLADVIARLDDGRPGAEEAWGLIPLNEGATVVWTVEMAQAFGAASPLLERGDKVAARMAFLESYRKLVADARANFVEPSWDISLGWDERGREKPIREAVTKGRLSYESALAFLPPQNAEPLISLPSKFEVTDEDRAAGARHISEIRALLKPPREPGSDDEQAA